MKTFIGKQSVELHQYDKSTLELVEEIVQTNDREGKDDPFVIADLGDIVNKYRGWLKTIPRVRPFYAVKCNDDQPILKILADMGASFDCASKGEIQKVLSLGVQPERIIYANPCKQQSMLKYAAKQQVAKMTFDNEAELYKIKSIYPNAQCVLRILPPSNFKVQCELGIKFGCHPSKAGNLLEIAKQLDLNVMGISFHVGSGCEEASAFSVAIQQARDVFDLALQMGFDMTLLDIGGGFPGQESAAVSFTEIATVVNMALDKYFPAGEGIDIISEPGRYFVASAYTVAVNIIAKRVVARDQHGENGELLDHPSASDEPSIMYYVNDGVYGSFNCLLYDHASVAVNTLKDDEDFCFESSVWGPTCDGLDCILEKVPLVEHGVGEWLYFRDMGAYTMAAASAFNGMPAPSRYYYCNAEIWQEVYPEHAPKQLTRSKPLPAMRAGRDLQDPAAPNFLSTSAPTLCSPRPILGSPFSSYPVEVVDN